MNLASDLSTSIVAGNYICFNGDGALSVTSTAQGTLKFTAGAKGDTAEHTFTDEIIYTILPDDLNATTDGKYYVDVELTGVKLISAEISNRPYTAAQIVKPKSVTYQDMEFISGHQSGRTLSWGSRPVTAAGTKSWDTTEMVEEETGTTGTCTISNCNTLTTGTSKSDGALTYKELSRGGSATLPSSAAWNSVCYGGDKFVTVASSSTKAAYSTTGTGTWSAATLPSSAFWYSVCYGDGTSSGGAKFVTVACNSTAAAYSTTGTSTWSAATLPSRGDWSSVCYGGNKFVSVAWGSTTAAYSTDGTGTWSAATLPSKANWQSVCYGGGKFVTVAENSTKAAYSTDGINWLGSDCQLSFTQKGKISITTTGSGTLTFKSGVSGTTEYSVSSTQTTEVEESRLIGSRLNYLLSDGVYTSEIKLVTTETKTASVEKETIDHTVTVNVTDTTDKLCLRSTTNATATWALADSSGTVTKADVTPSNSNNGRYYYDVTNGSTPKYAKRTLSDSITEEVYDVIDFINTNSPTAKNGVLSIEGLKGTSTYKLYMVESASEAKIKANKLGMIELVVAPWLTSANGGTIKLLHGSNTTQKTITEKTTIRIPASDMQMSGTAPNATYYMDFNCANLVILRAKFLRWQPRFSKPTVPNLSSYVDFSQKTSNRKPVHGASSLAVFGKDTTGALGTISYDSDRGYWCATGGNNNFYDMQPYAKGDGYLLVEDLSASTATFDIWYGVDGTKASRWKYYLPGLTRLYFDEAQMNPSNGFSSGGKHAFLVGGVTQPINAALYNYAKGKIAADGEDLTAYVKPSTDFNRATLKALTTAACSKLKDAGVRVYVVKYRKQSGWKALTRNGTGAHSSGSGTHSYTEIDACATSTGGTAYDVADEAALKTTLDTIAAAIKTWAGYEEAKNVAE